jgi:hypothetical protein
LDWLYILDPWRGVILDGWAGLQDFQVFCGFSGLDIDDKLWRYIHTTYAVYYEIENN